MRWEVLLLMLLLHEAIVELWRRRSRVGWTGIGRVGRGESLRMRCRLGGWSSSSSVELVLVWIWVGVREVRRLLGLALALRMRLSLSLLLLVGGEGAWVEGGF